MANCKSIKTYNRVHSVCYYQYQIVVGHNAFRIGSKITDLNNMTSGGACNSARFYDEEMSEHQAQLPLSQTGKCQKDHNNGRKQSDCNNTGIRPLA